MLNDSYIFEKYQYWITNLCQYEISYARNKAYSKMDSYNKSSSALLKQRKLGGVICNTSEDIVIGLGRLKSQNEQEFIESLRCAIFEGDMDIICGHIDWFREKAALPTLSAYQRDEVKEFYKQYINQHPPDGILRMAQFISAALEHFSEIA